VRNILCNTLVKCSDNPKFVFLTGDLGYQALEPLRESLGERFINAGVAEQNMVSVAAGLAKTGLQPWVYSIAPLFMPVHLNKFAMMSVCTIFPYDWLVMVAVMLMG
jgi:transketolase C-terminal domain/subunit